MNRGNMPDHGEHFVPGGEEAPNRAPQPLDHFKRGYRERTDQRERETDFLNDFDNRGSSGSNGNSHSNSGVGAGDGNRNNHPNYKNNNSNSEYYQGNGGGGNPPGNRRSSNYNDRSSYNDYGDRRPSARDGQRYHSRERHANDRGGNYHGGGDRRYSGDRGEDRGGRGQVIMGLDVQSLVDRLCRRDVDVFRQLDDAREEHLAVFQSGKAVTAIISNLARRRNLRLAGTVWDWIDTVGIKKNTFHYNSMISVCEKVRDHKKALFLLDEMRDKGVEKNEVTFSSAISACEKCGQWRLALDLLDQMKREGSGQTAIAYNAAISACEKGLVPHKALEIFEQMKREGVRPTVVTYSALISAAEKGQQWKLALEVLEEMKAAGHGANVIAYSAAISALSKGQMWQKALELFREIEASGGKPSIVTYNATMTALEKGLQWELALDLFDEMKMKNMPVTVVSYGSAISACEKGLQYRQCLEYLDEMTEMGIKKNVIIFGAAMSCMEKSCRADIAFLLMERMKVEGVAPNVHIYNSAISACARCNLWEKGYQLFQEMEQVCVPRDVVTYNALLDAVCTQVELGRRLFIEGVEKGFYARVSRLGTQWLELDLHFLSLGGGEIALGWWFEECLVPYLVNTSKLEAVQSISIVTGYGKTRSRGARLNDDGMRLRVRAMLRYMNISETPQPNKGRIHINKAELIEEVKRNGGKIRFDLAAYKKFKEEETTANKFPDVPQRVRARFRPARPGEGPAGTFIREGGNEEPHDHGQDNREPWRENQRHADTYQQERRESRRSSNMNEDRGGRPSWQQDRRSSYNDRNYEQRGGYGEDWKSQERRGNFQEQGRRDSFGRERDQDMRGHEDYQERRRGYSEPVDRRGGHDQDRRGRQSEILDRQGGAREDWGRRGSLDRERRPSQYERDRHEDRGDDLRGDNSRRSFQRPPTRDAFYRDDRPGSFEGQYGRGGAREYDPTDRQLDRNMESGRNEHFQESGGGQPMDRPNKRQRHSLQFGEATGRNDAHQKRVSDSVLYTNRRGGMSSDTIKQFATIQEDPDSHREQENGPLEVQGKKRGLDDYQKPATSSRGYNIEPSYPKRRGS